jgi:hypothetical protein
MQERARKKSEEKEGQWSMDKHRSFVAFAYRFVKLKLITLPMRLMVKVHPKAMANSLFLNQYAVMVFCAIVIEPPPKPKMNLPTNIKMYR